MAPTNKAYDDKSRPRNQPMIPTIVKMIAKKVQRPINKLKSGATMLDCCAATNRARTAGLIFMIGAEAILGSPGISPVETRRRCTMTCETRRVYELRKGGGAEAPPGT